MKWNLLRTSSFDVALDPSAHVTYLITIEEGGTVTQVHVPILLGLRFGDDVTLVASLGASYVELVSDRLDYGATSIAAHGGLMVRAGLGVNVRTGRSSAVQPEITVLRAINDTQGLIVAFGFGVTFGRLPDP